MVYEFRGDFRYLFSLVGVFWFFLCLVYVGWVSMFQFFCLWIVSYVVGVLEDFFFVEGLLVDIVVVFVWDYFDVFVLQFFGREMIYVQLQVVIDCVVVGLCDFGVCVGDLVVIVLFNCLQYIVVFYVVFCFGVVVVEYNLFYIFWEFCKQFEDYGVKYVIVWNKVVFIVQDFFVDFMVMNFVLVDVICVMLVFIWFVFWFLVVKVWELCVVLMEKVCGIVVWDFLFGIVLLFLMYLKFVIDDFVIIQYIFGMMGMLKGVVLMYWNLFVNVVQVQVWVFLIQCGKGCVVYVVLLMFYVYGFMFCFIFVMLMGVWLVLFLKFDFDFVFDVVKKYLVIFFFFVLLIVDCLLVVVDVKGVFFDGIEVVIFGVMVLFYELVVFFEKVMNGFFVEGYGLSECLLVFMVNLVVDNWVFGIVGLLLFGIEC